MKKRYIIGGIIAIAFMALAVFSLDMTEYADIPSAVESGKRVQIICAWEKNKPFNYDYEKNFFTFYAQDKSEKSDEIVKVEYFGPKPPNFDIADRVVIKGHYRDGAFHAEEILTKCPSKYESQVDGLRAKQDSIDY